MQYNQLTSDDELRDNIIDEIAYDPIVTHFDIQVTAKNGVVTLEGVVDTTVTRSAAEHAAWRVFGVQDVVDNIRVA